MRSQYSVVNTFELAKNINGVILSAGSIFISFDVTALFPKISILPTLDIAEKLSAVNPVAPSVLELMDFLHKCLRANFCKYDSQFYKFPNDFRVPIGSPLGSMMVEISMRFR